MLTIIYGFGSKAIIWTSTNNGNSLLDELSGCLSKTTNKGLDTKSLFN